RRRRDRARGDVHAAADLGSAARGAWLDSLRRGARPASGRARARRAARRGAALPLCLAGRHQRPLLLRTQPGGGRAEPVQVIDTPPIDWFGLSPVLALTGTAFAALLCAVLVPRAARRLAAASISAVGFVAGIVLSIWLYVDSANGHTIVAGAFYRDRWTALGQVILCGLGLVTTLLAVEHVPGCRSYADLDRRDDHIAEFFALLLASGAGMAFFVGAANLMVLFLALEWFSIALYVMCAIDYRV